MALNSLGLGFLFTATDMASSVMGEIESNLKSLEEVSGRSINGMSKHLQVLGAGVALAAVGIGGLSAGFALANKAGEFESAIAAVGAVSQASSADLELLRKAALDAGVATQFSPTQATLGLNELAQAGYNAQESIELLKPALDLAAGSLGQLSPAEAAGVAAQAMKAFGIEMKYATAAVDQMLMASNMFAMRADDLPLALGIASRGAQALNQSLTETVIAVGLVKNTVPGTERASTAVAVAMEKMVQPKVQQRLAALGIAVADAKGQFRPFLDILGDMAPALGKMSEKARGAFLEKTFGAEALTGINTILNQVNNGIKTSSGEIVKGGAALEYLRDSFSSAEGVAAEFSKKMLDTFAGQKTLLAGSMETLAVQLGTPFATALKPAVEATIEVVNSFLKWVSTLDDDTKTMAARIFLGASAFAAIAGAVLVLVGILPIFAGLLSIGTSMLWGWAAAATAAMLPWLPWIALAGLIVAAVLAVKNNWLGLGDIVLPVLRRIGDGFKAAWVWVQDFAAQWVRVGRWAADAFMATAELLIAAWDYTVAWLKEQGIWDAIVAGLELVKDGAVAVFNFYVQTWSGIFDFIGKIFTAAQSSVSGVTEFVMGNIEKVKAAVGGAIDWVGSLATKVGGFIEGLPEWIRARAVDVKVATPGATGGSRSFSEGIESASRASSNMPASAATEAFAQSIAADVIDYDKLGEKVAEASARRPFVATLEIDGDVLAEQTSRRDRNNANRGNRPVGGR